MGKSRSLAISMLGVACLFLIACQTAGTPTKSRDTAVHNAPPPADSASRNRTASYAGDVKSVTSAQRKNRTAKVVDRLGNLSRAVMGKKIDTLRAILYVTLAVIFVIVIGAIAAERVGRHRKLAPSSLNARH